MKCFIKLFAIFFLYNFINAQECLYDHVKFGKYQVGITDTVIYDSIYNYEQFGYKGKKPYFLKIWHPVLKSQKSKYLNVEEIFAINKNTNLKCLTDSLQSIYKINFIRDYLEEGLENGNQNKYGKYSLEDIYSLIGKLETRSISAGLNFKSDLPLIIYYNGSQGHPYENFLLAEYFASRGFIFVSASFELQFENLPFGMLPYHRFHSNEYEESLKTVTRFAQSITSSSNLFFVGHSMGAQMGLRTFGQDNSIKGMVSLETSIEFKTDYEEIKELWPEVYKKIIIEKEYYPFPILFCAATGESKPFNFLEKVKSPNVTYVSTIKEFEHNAYLTLFYLRFCLDNSVEQSDKGIIKKRIPIYSKHIESVYNFIDGIINCKKELKSNTVLMIE